MMNGISLTYTKIINFPTGESVQDRLEVYTEALRWDKLINFFIIKKNGANVRLGLHWTWVET